MVVIGNMEHVYATIGGPHNCSAGYDGEEETKLLQTMIII